MELTVEIFNNALMSWKNIAKLHIEGSKAQLSYHFETVVELLQESAKSQSGDQNQLTASIHRPSISVSLREPISFDTYYTQTHGRWLPFLFDLIPQGYAREYLYRKYEIQREQSGDLLALAVGAMNQPGNVRLFPVHLEHMQKLGLSISHAREIQNERHLIERRQEATSFIPNLPQFTFAEVGAKQQDFIEHCQSYGAPGSGGSAGAQGEAPKYLLRATHEGGLQSDGCVPDSQTAICYIVKFPRKKTRRDKEILQAEKTYMEIADQLGLNVWNADKFQFLPGATDNDAALFVPRFDRIPKDGKIAYLGLESMASAMGLAGYGNIRSQNEVCNTILEFSSQPIEDLIEYLKRDLLNILLRNTDNHLRNSAFLKNTDDTVKLSPLFDFAPMAFDSEGIARLNIFNSETKNASDLGYNVPNYALEIDSIFQVTQKKECSKNKNFELEKKKVKTEFGKFLTLLQNKKIESLLNDSSTAVPTFILENIPLYSQNRLEAITSQFERNMK